MVEEALLALLNPFFLLAFFDRVNRRSYAYLVNNFVVRLYRRREYCQNMISRLVQRFL